jgi:transposase
MGPALLLIAQMYRVEKQARSLTAPERLQLRQLQSRPILDKLRSYLLEIEPAVLPKSPEGRAVRYTLKNWTALTRFCEDGDLEIDNNATEACIRGVAKGEFIVHLIFKCLKTWTFGFRNSADTDDLFVRSPQ